MTSAAARVRWTARGFLGLATASWLLVPLVFAALVLVMWLPFGPRNGMPYETAFPYASEHSSWQGGFIYHGDALRPYTSVFYHLSYLLGEVTGHAGSFVPFQLVYATLWWARGLLVFLILAPFFGRRSVVPLLGGALTILHASDHALNWVGQMNQFGMMFWLLLALWLLLRSLLAKSIVASVVLCFGAVCAARMCLWSYESGLFIILVVPVLFLVFAKKWRSPYKLALTGIFYIVPAYYIELSIKRYVIGSGFTYQESVARDDLSVHTFISDLVFNIRTSVEFWNWGSQMPPANLHSMHLLGAAAAAGIVAGGAPVYFHSRERVTRRGLLVLAGAGALVLILSFPAYLVLASSRLVWRTQFLSGIGFGVFAAAIVLLSASIVRNRAASFAITFAAAATVAFFGASASYRAAHFHYGIWVRHKHAIEEILEAAPRVKSGTVIVYTGIPFSADPFGDVYWFDLALRLAYPDTSVTGTYYREGGTVAPGATLALRHGSWSGAAPLSRTLFFRYSYGEARALTRVPLFLADAAKGGRYDPRSVVEQGHPDPRAVRRYGPLDPKELPVGR